MTMTKEETILLLRKRFIGGILDFYFFMIIVMMVKKIFFIENIFFTSLGIFFIYFSIVPYFTKGYRISGLLLGIKIISSSKSFYYNLWMYSARIFLVFISIFSTFFFRYVTINSLGQLPYDEKLNTVVIGKTTQIDKNKKIKYYNDDVMLFIFLKMFSVVGIYIVIIISIVLFKKLF